MTSMYDWRIECYERAIAFAETRGIPLEPLEQFGHLEHFHYGGAAACREWVYHLDIAPDDRVLDIGCGVGGTGRYMWREIGCSYDGVDVRADFVAFAVQLGERMAYDGLRFHHIDAQSDPLPPCDVAIAALSLGQMDGARCLENLARALSDRSRYLIEMIVERTGYGELETAMVELTGARR